MVSQLIVLLYLLLFLLSVFSGQAPSRATIRAEMHHNLTAPSLMITGSFKHLNNFVRHDREATAQSVQTYSGKMKLFSTRPRIRPALPASMPIIIMIAFSHLSNSSNAAWHSTSVNSAELLAIPAEYVPNHQVRSQLLVTRSYGSLPKYAVPEYSLKPRCALCTFPSP